MIDAFSHALAPECVRKQGPLATSLSTKLTARDRGFLRCAFSEKQMTISGQSYGRPLASAYASLLPQNVRGMLLDAASHHHFHNGHVESGAEHLLSFETVLQLPDKACSVSPACRCARPAFGSTLEALKLQLAQAAVTGLRDAEPSVSGLQYSLHLSGFNPGRRMFSQVRQCGCRKPTRSLVPAWPDFASRVTTMAVLASTSECLSGCTHMHLAR